MTARAAAARALVAVGEGRSLDAALARVRAEVAADEQPLLQELVYGGVRYRLRLEPLIAARLRKPLKARDRDLHGLLTIALYELMAMRTPQHAAVSAAVEAASALGKPWARGLVNGVLRALLRDPGAFDPPADPGRAHAWPDWLARAIAHDWPADWPAIAASGTARPPMTLRVNTACQSVAAYRQRLAAAGIEAQPGAAPTALTLAHPVSVESLPGFAEGAVSVQDAAAQWAVPLLEVAPGARVLDACAAPGGKTGQLLEQHPDMGELVAVEADAARAERLRATLERVGGGAVTPLVADAAASATWWDGRAFDRILLDAPCSGTGVVRRHPDIKLLRRAQDIPALVAEQWRLLTALWPLLAPGGMLVYVTCSILRRENAELIASFLAAHPGAEACAIEQSWGRADGPGRQILPGSQEMDGFFYARLAKRSANRG